MKVVVDYRILKECRRVSKIKNSSVGEMLKLNNLNTGTLNRAICDHVDGNFVLTDEAYKKICKVFNITDDRFLIREMSREESKEYYISAKTSSGKAKKRHQSRKKKRSSRKRL